MAGRGLTCRGLTCGGLICGGLICGGLTCRGLTCGRLTWGRLTCKWLTCGGLTCGRLSCGRLPCGGLTCRGLICGGLTCSGLICKRLTCRGLTFGRLTWGRLTCGGLTWRGLTWRGLTCGAPSFDPVTWTRTAANTETIDNCPYACYYTRMPGKLSLDSLVNGFLPMLKEYMGQAYGMCNTCGEPALPIHCCVCGEPSCLRCAWIRGEMITERGIPRLVCSLCVDAIEVEGGAEWQQTPGVADVAAERRAWALDMLGLKEGFSSKELKAAYRKLSKKYHPDHNQGDSVAEAAFKQVAQAYEVLKGE